MTRAVTVIYTEERRGVGTEEDKCRFVPQLWTLDGRLIAEEDPCGKAYAEGLRHTLSLEAPR